MDKDIWFPAKTYGWGWGLPVKWQGWVAMLVYLAFSVSLAFWVNPEIYLKEFLFLLGLATAVMLVICWVKGETPRWQWGKKYP